jgi:glutathione S-transferase
MAVAIIRGLDSRIEKIPSNPHESPADLVADNPLSKVPCLVTDDGLSLFGSQLICEYLDSIGEALPLFPGHGPARWRALKYQSLGDGILDAAVPCRGEQGKPQEAARDAQIARFKAAISRAVDALEADPPHKHVDIGSITVACALGYLDFRFAADRWRNGHPKLAAWYEAFAGNKGIAETAPPT